MSTSERRSLLEDKRRLLGSMRQSLGMKNPIAPFAQNPVTAADDGRNSFTKMTKRHKKDQDFIISNFKEHPETEFTPIYQTTFDDDRDPILEPTFSKHRIPLQIRCLERYHISKKEYAHQFKREIDLLIENQPTAESAWQFDHGLYNSLAATAHKERAQDVRKGLLQAIAS